MAWQQQTGKCNSRGIVWPLFSLVSSSGDGLLKYLSNITDVVVCTIGTDDEDSDEYLLICNKIETQAKTDAVALPPSSICTWLTS